MTESKENATMKKRLSWFLVGNAIVWGAVIIGAALVIGGSGQMPKLLPILGGGAGFSTVILPTILTGKKQA